jgi:hypothetical protein
MLNSRITWKKIFIPRNYNNINLPVYVELHASIIETQDWFYNMIDLIDMLNVN